MDDFGSTVYSIAVAVIGTTCIARELPNNVTLTAFQYHIDIMISFQPQARGLYRHW